MNVANAPIGGMTEDLASHHRCLDRLRQQWPAFLDLRRQRLTQQERHGQAVERVTEEILADLLTGPLDWTVADLNHQVAFADLVLTRLGIKYLIVETKRPGNLAWHEHTVHTALEQAQRYAHEQAVRCVAVSDGMMLYAADVEHGGLRDRAYVSLESAEPSEDLWWLSVHGIYRPRSDTPAQLLPPMPPFVETSPIGLTLGPGAMLLHPRYKLPSACFAYVGDPAAPATWKLPFLRADGAVDLARLPKAIQSILTNYRGARVEAIPESAVPDVLVRLARAAASVGKLPHHGSRQSSGSCAPAVEDRQTRGPETGPRLTTPARS